jgi:hypothetical protein
MALWCNQRTKKFLPAKKEEPKCAGLQFSAPQCISGTGSAPNMEELLKDACTMGQVEEVEDLLAKGVDPDCPDETGKFPFSGMDL